MASQPRPSLPPRTRRSPGRASPAGRARVEPGQHRRHHSWMTYNHPSDARASLLAVLCRPAVATSLIVLAVSTAGAQATKPTSSVRPPAAMAAIREADLKRDMYALAG